ncbi:Scr1 family TA system antitoxin-like transcriptional regulator [Nocardia carnea]|uniref:Scr1 family TA system antitoxin-like transcriptional regulator n=1 Tax=Nocardia carnea TaxID=37328 RepID=UPI003D773A92
MRAWSGPPNDPLSTAGSRLPANLQVCPRGLIESFLGDGSTQDIEQRIRTRLKRQVMATRKHSPLQREVLLHKSATRHVIGSPEIMAAQMRQLAEVSKLANVTVRKADSPRTSTAVASDQSLARLIDHPSDRRPQPAFTGFSPLPPN